MSGHRSGILPGIVRGIVPGIVHGMFGHCSGTIPRPTVTWPKHRPMTAPQRDVQRWKWSLKTLLMWTVIVVDDDVLVVVDDAVLVDSAARTCNQNWIPPVSACTVVAMGLWPWSLGHHQAGPIPSACHWCFSLVVLQPQRRAWRNSQVQNSATDTRSLPAASL